MKREIRGSIEKALDEFLKGVGGAVDRVSWVEKFVPITSKEELVLGYIIGTFETFALSVTEFLRQKKLSKSEKEKEDNEIRAMIRRRLPEILDRIESELNK